MSSPKPIKPKKCRSCKTPFTPWNTLQVACSPKCALILTREAANKKEKAKIKVKKEALKTVADHKLELQIIFNKWVRLTDNGQPCISCQRHHQGQYHAGHYRSRGSCPELRYEPDNCHLQGAPCHNPLSGNLINYRVNLIKKIGLERVEWLEGKHEPKKYTIEELKKLKVEYKAKIKQLEQDLAA